MRPLLVISVTLSLLAVSLAPPERWALAPVPPLALAAPETLVVAADSLTMSADIWFNPGSRGGCGCLPTRASSGASGNITFGLHPGVAGFGPGIGAPESLWVETVSGTYVTAPLEWTTPQEYSRFVNSIPPYAVGQGSVRLRFLDGSGAPLYIACRPLVSLPV